jgi:hypothetical protein
MLGYTTTSLEIGDLPIVPANMRAIFNYSTMKKAMREVRLSIGTWRPRPGSGWELCYRLLRVNKLVFTAEIVLAAISAVLFYTPAFFLRRLVGYLEVDKLREDRGWGWVYVIGLFSANVLVSIGESPSALLYVANK